MAIYTISLYIACDDLVCGCEHGREREKNRPAGLYEGRGDNAGIRDFGQPDWMEPISPSA